MSQDLISVEVAKKEVNKWLDYKNVSQRKREKKEIKTNIDTIVDAICDGDLILDKDFNFIKKLRNPVKDNEGKVVLGELKFKPRLYLEEVETHMMNVNSSNTFGMLRAYTSALTGVGSGLLSKLTTDDNSVVQAIVMFFL